ncbi:MAG: FAD-dependent oxidoreductase [Clostridia bacterium]|nr:FAD-dependent oxidoreductase [Clostridia bacterium]
MFIVEKERQTEVKGTFDTVVCGGGIAGISAALAAARKGAKTLLIEKQYLLGGLATLGLVTIYLPLCDGRGRQVSFGIAEELLRLSVRHGSEDGRDAKPWFENGTVEERTKKRFEVQYNPNLFSIEAEKLLVDANVTILYGTAVCGVSLKDGIISHVLTENIDGRGAYATKNVIDATGDAMVCALAGEGTVNFSQGNVPAYWYYGEENGKTKLHMLGMCDIPDSKKTPEQKAAAKSSLRYSGLDQSELSSLSVYMHQKIAQHYLAGGGIEEGRSLSLIPTIPQIRMTRRIDGVYTQDDTEMHKSYSDSVGLFSDWREAGPVYELPFDCLRGKSIKNLLACGRMISSTDAMWDITRVIPVCAVSGEAAGVAAALFDRFDKADIALLQETLKQNGVVLHESDL